MPEHEIRLPAAQIEGSGSARWDIRAEVYRTERRGPDYRYEGGCRGHVATSVLTSADVPGDLEHHLGRGRCMGGRYMYLGI